METGELFGWISNQWRRTGLYCSTQPFVLDELNAMTTRCSAVLRMDLEQEQQTRVVQLSGDARQGTVQLPPLPLMPEPEAYVIQADVMTLQMRRNYVRDRTQAALTYIKEYETSQEWEQNPQYDIQQVRQRLQIVYGKADQVKQKVDVALLNDDIYRRRRVMRTLELPHRFPSPQTMKDSSVVTWVQWIREESNKLIAAIEDEIARRQDPDDPFDGTASGVFSPLQNAMPAQQKTAFKKQSSQIKVDESRSPNPQLTEGAVGGRMTEVKSPARPQTVAQTVQQQGTASAQSNMEHTIDSSQNRTSIQGQQNAVVNQPMDVVSTQRRIEESQTENSEDPFRTIRSLHEKQRTDQQGVNQLGDPQRASVSSQSIAEGMMREAGSLPPKPQRQSKKYKAQAQGQEAPQPVTNRSVNIQQQQNSYYQGPHNTTAYMNLPISLQSKICGRCGLMGHVKKFCREEVYCKYCRMPTHSTTACRTYPSTSSRKNTPEKRTSEEIDHEVNRRVQEGVLRIITELSTNRQVVDNQGMLHVQQGSVQGGTANQGFVNQPEDDNTPYQHIPEQRHGSRNLIDDLQRPPEAFEQQRGEPNSVGRGDEVSHQNPILNQQWGEQLHQRPPLRPTPVVNNQVGDDIQQATVPSATAKVNVEAATTQRRIEESREENPVQQGSAHATTNVHLNRVDPATNRQVEQIGCVQCNSSPPVIE